MTAVALCWLLVALWGALRLRPGAARRARPAALRPAPVRAAAGFWPAPVLGRAVRSLLGRPADAAADRRADTAVLILIAGLIFDPLVGLVGAATWWLLSRRAELRRRRRATAVVTAELPEALNLLALAAGAGLSVRQSLAAVAPRLAGPVGEALQRAHRQITLGVDTAAALEALAAGADEPLRLLVRPLLDTLQHGSPMVPALEQAAATARLERRRGADLAARKVPMRLLFPLTVCVLPAFVLLTIVPLVVQSLDRLRF